MSNTPEDEDLPMLSMDDAYAIGEKVMEMADRVKAVNPAVPGVRATWFLTVDGTRFEMVMTVASSQETPA